MEMSKQFYKEASAFKHIEINFVIQIKNLRI